MKLFVKKLGAGPSLVILHGLYGSHGNWLNIARQLQKYHTVYIPDLRNHGKSPHAPGHTYNEMAEDIYILFGKENLQKTVLIGHSMGGKLAMYFADRYPELIEKLIIVDIAPKSYLADKGYQSQIEQHKKIISAMQQLPMDSISSREEADEVLSPFIPNNGIRNFLLKNLIRNKSGQYAWSINLDAIAQQMPVIFGGVLNNRVQSNYNKSALFIKGEKSSYILDTDWNMITQVFPKAQMVQIANAGHWLHVEQTQEFISTVLNFL